MMTVEITSALQASRKSPLADEIFKIEGIKSILLGSDFLTVTKGSEVSWPQVNPQVFAAIMDFFTTGQDVLNNLEPSSKSEAVVGESEASISEKAELDPRNAEILEMIKEILDTRIRPTIQDDGGDVELRGFDSKTGWVQLKLVVACRTCSSSTITLRNGIESMLMHYIPEVKGVEQVADEEELVSSQEFDKFEKELTDKRQKE